MVLRAAAAAADVTGFEPDSEGSGGSFPSHASADSAAMGLAAAASAAAAADSAAAESCIDRVNI